MDIALSAMSAGNTAGDTSLQQDAARTSLVSCSIALLQRPAKAHCIPVGVPPLLSCCACQKQSDLSIAALHQSLRPVLAQHEVQQLMTQANYHLAQAKSIRTCAKETHPN